jgi:hypothetical protein
MEGISKTSKDYYAIEISDSEEESAPLPLQPKTPSPKKVKFYNKRRLCGPGIGSGVGIG